MSRLVQLRSKPDLIMTFETLIEFAQIIWGEVVIFAGPVLIVGSHWFY